jgi:hypothetical protein
MDCWAEHEDAIGAKEARLHNSVNKLLIITFKNPQVLSQHLK